MKPGSLTMNRDDGDFTKEQLDAETIGRNYDWKSREIPSNYDPVQLDTFDPPARFIDWWNTRSTFLCCLFPCLSCISSHKTFDGTDPTVWKKQLENPNKGVPESMQGLWWLKDNVAHEQLMTIFGDADFVGTYNEDGTDGYGMWYRPFRHNWARENSMFGHVLGVNGNRGNIKVSGRMNLKDGILTVHTGLGDGNQIVYKVNDEEWWKVHYAGNPVSTGMISNIRYQISIRYGAYYILFYILHLYALLRVLHNIENDRAHRQSFLSAGRGFARRNNLHVQMAQSAR